MSPKLFFLKVTNNKTVWLTSFQVQEFLSVTIFFKFVHLFLPAFVSAVLFIPSFRACLHGEGGPQIGEVTRLAGVTRLSI